MEGISTIVLDGTPLRNDLKSKWAFEDKLHVETVILGGGVSYGLEGNQSLRTEARALKTSGHHARSLPCGVDGCKPG